MVNLIAAEFLKLRKRPMTWWLLGILLIVITLTFVIVYQVGIHSTGGSVRSITLPQGPGTAVTATGAIFDNLLLIAMAVVLGNEFQYGTLRTQLAMGVRRTPYLLAKALAVLIAGLLGLIVCILFGTLLSILSTVVHSDTLQWAGAFGQPFWHGLAVLALSALARFGLALFVTLLARSVAAGVAVSLVYTILEGTITTLLGALGGVWADLANAFVATNIRALSTNLNRTVRATQHLLSAPAAVAVLLAYAIGFIVVSLVIFNRRDVKGAA